MSPTVPNADIPDLPELADPTTARPATVSDSFASNVAMNLAFIGLRQGGTPIAQRFCRLG